MIYQSLIFEKIFYTERWLKFKNPMLKMKECLFRLLFLKNLLKNNAVTVNQINY